MSVGSFRSVFMVASCAGAALGCYLVSLRVASERAALDEVEMRIVLAQRDIRLLQTEIGTRGRLAQLERWNAKVLALSAPSADQFLEGGFALARMVAPEIKPDLEAPVVLAAAPRPGPAPIGGADAKAGEAGSASPSDLMHQASLKRPDRPETAQVARRDSGAPANPSSATKVDPPAKTATAAKPLAKPLVKTASPTKPAAKPAKPAPRLASVDPLAPRPARSATAKDDGSTQ